MRVKGIDHVQLAMPAGEEAKARAFYQDLMDLPEVPKPPQLAARGGCWFGAGAEKIHLGVEDHFRPARKAHPALLAEDLPALRALLAAAGYNSTTGEPVEGYVRAYVNDPFGNRLELIEPCEFGGLWFAYPLA